MNSQRIVFDDISKTYADGTTVLNGLSGKFDAKNIIVILGENGIGKTTFLDIVADLLSCTVGKIDVRSNSLGYMGQNSKKSFYDLISVYENLKFFAGLNDYNLTRKECLEQLEYFSLSKIIDKQVFKLSGGLTQIISFLRAFLHKPDLLVLDEPFANIDPERSARMCGFIRDYVDRYESTVLISSHTLENIARVYTGIYFISKFGGFSLEPEIIKEFQSELAIIDLLIPKQSFDRFILDLKKEKVLLHRSNGVHSHTLLVNKMFELSTDMKQYISSITTRSPVLSDLSFILQYEKYLELIYKRGNKL